MSEMNQPGIYRITIQRGDKPNWTYIGHAAILRKRRDKHFSEMRRGIHKNERMQRAFNKYGPDAFSFEVLAICARDPVELEAKETALLKSEIERRGRDLVLNVCLECVGSALGVKRRPETKAKQSAKMKGRKPAPQTIEAMVRAHLGVKQSAETQAKRSASLLKNIEHREASAARLTLLNKSPERRQEVSEQFKGKVRPPELMSRCLATRRANAEARGYWTPPGAAEKAAVKNRGRSPSKEHRAKIAKANYERAEREGAASFLMPWLAEGISRTTWYRRRCKAKRVKHVDSDRRGQIEVVAARDVGETI